MKCILLFVILLNTAYASAATYYLKPTGNDGLDGLTEDKAWATFNQADMAVSAGDTIVVMDGSWNITESIRLRAKGKPGKPITYVAQNKHAAKIIHPTKSGGDAAVAVGVYDGGNGGWQEWQSMYTVLDGLDIKGGKRHAIQSAGGGYLTIQNCLLHDSGNDAVKINSGADHVTIQNNEIYNTGIEDSCNNNPPEGCNSEGIDATSSDYLIIQDNYFHDILSWGITPKKGCRNVTIRRNIIINCEEGGIALGESTVCYNCQAYNNLIADTYLSCLSTSGAKNSGFFNNTCYDSSVYDTINWPVVRASNSQSLTGVDIILQFSSGGPAEAEIGDILVGATSGDSGAVEEINLTSGSWAGGDAVGTIRLREQFDDGVYDAFNDSAENINISGKQDNIMSIGPDTLKDDKYVENLTVENNILIINGNGTTGFKATSTAFASGGGNIAELSLKNNLYYNISGTLTPSNITFYFNGVHLETGLSSWQTYTSGLGNEQDTNSLINDPDFASTTSTDSDYLKLKEDSPAVDKGTTTLYATDYAGNVRIEPYDIGAFEYYEGQLTPFSWGLFLPVNKNKTQQ